MFICNLPELQEIIAKLERRAKLGKSSNITFDNLDKESPISLIKLYQNPHGGSLGFTIYYRDNTNVTVLGLAFNDIQLQLINFPDVKALYSLNYVQIFTRNQNYNKLLESLLLFEKLDKIDPKFILFFQRLWNICKPEQRIADEVFGLVKKGEYSTAIEKAKTAQADEYYEVIWELANQLHSNNLVDKKTLIDLYENIKQENPNYPDANERLVMLFTPDLFPKQSEFFCLEKQLRAAIKSNQQVVVGQIFHSLCGYKGAPLARELTGDVEGLIALATHIRMLNEVIKNQNVNNQLDTIKNTSDLSISSTTTNTLNNFFVPIPSPTVPNQQQPELQLSSDEQVYKSLGATH